MQFNQLRNNGSSPAVTPLYKRQTDNAALAHAIQQLADRISTTDTNSLNTLQGEIAQLNYALQQQDLEGGLQGDLNSVSGYKALEKSLNDIAAHIEYSDHDNARTLRALQARLAQMSARASNSSTQQMQNSAQTTGNLGARIGDLMAQIEHAEQQMNDQATLQSLENQIAQLSNGGLTGSHGVSAGISGHNGSLDAIKANMANLAGQLNNLSPQASDTSASVSKDLADLMARLDPQASQQFADPHIRDLELRISGLDQSLQQIQNSNSAGSVKDFETQLRKFSKRLLATENRFGNLRSIEKSIAQISDAVDQNRVWAEKKINTPGNSSAVLAALGALEQRVKTIQANANSSDKHIKQAFETIYQNIDELSGRLDRVDNNGSAKAGNPAGPQAQQQKKQPYRSNYDKSELARKLALDGRQELRPPPSGVQAVYNPPVTPHPAPQPSPQLAAKQTNPPAPAQTPNKQEYLTAARHAAHMAAQSLQESEKKRRFGFGRQASSRRRARATAPSNASHYSPVRGRSLGLAATIVIAVAAAIIYNFMDGFGLHFTTPGSDNLITSSVKKAKPNTKNKRDQQGTNLPPVIIEQAQKPGQNPNNIATVKPGAKTVLTPQTTFSGVIDPTPPEIIGSKALRSAAMADNPAAQFEIAVRYSDGKKVPRDYNKAATWYQKAAAQGLGPAQYRLGTLYEKGRGVPLDQAAARIWYERAAEKGNVKAMHNLAVIYTNGASGQPNFSKAALWFRKAANFGLTDSQYNLAILNERGLGVPKNISEAYKWFAIAALNGDKEAKKPKDRLGKQLSKQELAKAKSLVSNWTPMPMVEDANKVEAPKGGWEGANKPVQTSLMSRRKMIAEAQALLNKLGFQAGPPDGVLGQQTQDAIRSFQTGNSLPATGDVSTILIERLRIIAG